MPPNAEITFDENLNKSQSNNLKVTSQPNGKDAEDGTSNEDLTGMSFGRLIIIVLAICVLVAASIVSGFLWSWVAGVVVFVVLCFIFLIGFKWRWIYVAIRTTPRDLKALWCYIKLLLLNKEFERKNWSMPDIFHDVVRKHPNKACFLFEDEVWSFAKVEEFSLRVSAALRDQGVKRGQIVGVLMNNCPEVPAMWLGATRLGAVSPLINHNQTGAALIHSINVAQCDVLIYESEFDSAIQEVRKDLSSSLKLLKYIRRPLKDSKNAVNVVDSGNDFTTILENTTPPTWFASEGDGFHGKILYIYTSGTTGLPKAAVISSSKMVFFASGVHYLGGLRPSDVIYCPMPLYHSAGGCISTGQALIFGCTIVYRTKFSASNYFPDCIKYNATAAHYIGEMCRYILATPPSPTDKQHKVRTVYGNGMRPAIWTDFVTRFNIKRVAEFYGATEGNANIVNVNNKTGAIGFISRIIPAIYPIAIIKVDEQGEPIRNKKGLCQLAKINEPGVFIGKIRPNNPSRAYLGYADKNASEKKIVRDVFQHGDSAFISGDILIADELGYLTFMDRTGDTFRWRGENVSTTEVEAAISRLANQRDAAVYGVQIPDTEGRAGMCAIVDINDDLNLDKLAEDMRKDLPAYARPVFIRVMKAIDMTGTYKLQKGNMQKEGFNPSQINDKLFYLELKSGKYLPLGEEEYKKIISGHIRL